MHRRIGLVSVLLLLHACGGRETTTREQTHALSGDGGTGALACELPSSAASACAGPWRYQTYTAPCSTTQPDTTSDCHVCGVAVAGSVTYPSCIRPDPLVAKHFTPPVPYTTGKQCTRWSKPGPCTPDGCPDPVCLQWMTIKVPTATCGDLAATQLSASQTAVNNQLATIRQNAAAHSGPPLAPDQVGYTPNLQTANINGIGGLTCSFDIINYPSFVSWSDAGIKQQPDASRSAICGAPTVVTQVCNRCAQPAPRQCGLDAVAYSSTGLGRDQVAPGGDFNLAPRCLTCDDLALSDRGAPDGAATAQLKAACLLTNDFSDYSGAAGVRTSNIVAAKLLLELRGDQLTGAQRAAITQLYLSDPSAERTPACGLYWTPLAPGSGCGLAQPDLDALNASMALCLRLSDAHAAPEVRALYDQACMSDLAATVRALPAGCAQSTVADRYAALAVDWMRQVLGGVALDFLNAAGEDATVATLQDELAKIARWYANAKAAYSDAQRLAGDSDRVLAAFWLGVHQNGGYGSLSHNSAVTAAQLKNASSVDLNADRLVLLAAFSPVGSQPPPLHATPLLDLVGDAIEPVWRKLGDAILFHDLGCRFARCAQGGISDEVSDLWALLAALHDPTALAAQTARFANNTSHVQVDWQRVFKQLVANHATLEQAVVDDYPAALLTQYGNGGAYAPGLLATVPVALLPTNAVHLTRLIRDAAVRTKNFVDTGSLSGQRGEVLRAGIVKSHLADVQSDFSNRTQALASALTRYDQDRAALVNQLVAQVNNQGNMQTFTDRLNQLDASFDDAERRIEGYRRANQIDDARLGDFIGAWKQRSDATSGSGAYQTHAYLPFHVTPGHASYQADTQVTADQVGVVPGAAATSDVPVDGNGRVALPVTRGQLVHVQVESGPWAPTCALTSGGGPPATLGGIALTPVSSLAMTGPEGFSLTKSDSSYQVASHASTSSTDSYSDASASINGCLNTKFGVSSGAGQAFGIIAEVTTTLSTCLNLNTGVRASEVGADTTTAAGEARSSVNYATGLRSPKTPFPDFPVGSLLLVEVANDDPLRRALRVQVLHAGGSGMVVEKDAKLYMVVNDLGGCFSTADSTHGGFDVTLSVLTPASTLAQQLGPALADELGVLRASVDNYLLQRAFSSSDRAALQSSSLDDLRTRAGGISSLPQDLLALYTTRVDYELARIERAVDIANLRQQEAMAQLQVRELNDQLANALDQSRLLELLPMWTLRDLDGDQLRDKTAFLASLMSDDLYPIIRIRYPHLIDPANAAGLFPSGALIPSLQALVNVDWRAELYDQASLVSTAATAVGNAFNNEVLGASAIHTTPVVVSIPRPGINPNFVSGYPSVDPSRAAAIWSQIDASGRAVISVRPEDVYRVHGGPSVLVCSSQVAPVVQAMQVFLNVGDNPAGDSWNSMSYVAPMNVAANLLFETEHGAETYAVINDDWLRDPVHLLFGLSPEVATKINAFLTSPSVHGGAGEGLSPFTAFDLDLQYFRTPGPLDPALTDLQELLLVFEVEYRDGAGVIGVASCQ